jgi:stress-induced morphogen
MKQSLTLLFNYAPISVTVRDTLQRAFGPNAAIRTDEGEGGQVYVRIVSDRFDGMSDIVKQDLIWDALRQKMGPDAQAVALVLAFGTDQL